MLVEEASRTKVDNPDRLINTQGGCRFCGQIIQVEALPEWTEEEVNELVAELCSCIDAQYYQNEKRKKKKAHKKIEKLFYEPEEINVDKRNIEIMKTAVNLMVEDRLNGLTLDMEDGIKGKIKITSKGNIKVERIITEKEAYEA